MPPRRPLEPLEHGRAHWAGHVGAFDAGSPCASAHPSCAGSDLPQRGRRRHHCGQQAGRTGAFNGLASHPRKPSKRLCEDRGFADVSLTIRDAGRPNGSLHGTPLRFLPGRTMGDVTRWPSTCPSLPPRGSAGRAGGAGIGRRWCASRWIGADRSPGRPRSGTSPRVRPAGGRPQPGAAAPDARAGAPLTGTSRWQAQQAGEPARQSQHAAQARSPPPTTGRPRR